MIRAIITDIDGVIVGDKVGFNSPYPNGDIITRLTQIHALGIPIVLCSGKPHYAIGKIIADCKLDNPHITDGGAIIIDPITNTIIKKYSIDPSLVTQIVSAYINADMYVEIYTPDSYIVQKSQIREPLTKLHTHILQTPPIIVDDLLIESLHHDVIKVVPIAINIEDASRLKLIFNPFDTKLSLAVNVHPIANPHQFGLITTKGVSKKQSAMDVATALSMPLSEFLGIGDSTSDWSFMELCGYVGAVQNATDELKKLVSSKRDNGFVGSSVDENGMLSILDHFAL
ncbi:MAG: HAD family hydrolase [Patescibacteria group bacterium]